MQKKRVSALAAAMLLAATAAPSAHAFDVGGSNGWKFSTDGFVNVFGTYEVISKQPVDKVTGAALGGGELGGRNSTPDHNSRDFGVNVGLLPVGIGFNINAPTTNGVDYAIRLAMYPNISNHTSDRTDLNPNIDFREINMTATGSFGQILAGRAINLFMAKNILTDFTLFSVGVVGPLVEGKGGPTIGHIGYGYLYPQFDAQFRYTTPDMGGAKLAIEIGDPHSLGAATETSLPRVEAELSYATTFSGGKAQAWIGGTYNRAKESATGKHPSSLGGTGGVEVGMGPLDILASTYGGKDLGMLVVGGDQDANGKGRQSFGFLLQSTFMVTPATKVGVNYGQSRHWNTAFEDTAAGGFPNNIGKQQSATANLTYNVTKFCQLIGEYTWAEDRWMHGEKQHANIAALGTFIYW